MRRMKVEHTPRRRGREKVVANCPARVSVAVQMLSARQRRGAAMI
jgi:hypothetical protein